MTLSGSRGSSRPLASASIRPSRRSAALSTIAPPSELVSGRSNCATRGLRNRSGNSTHGVVLESRTRRPPSVKESCVSTAFLHTEVFVFLKLRELSGLEVEPDRAPARARGAEDERDAPECWV